MKKDERNPAGKLRSKWVAVQFDKEASHTRDDRVAKDPSIAFALSGQAATLRAARPDPSLRKESLFSMTIKPPWDGRLAHSRKQSFHDGIDMQLGAVNERKRGIRFVEQQSEIRARKHNRFHSLTLNKRMRQRS